MDLDTKSTKSDSYNDDSYSIVSYANSTLTQIRDGHSKVIERKIIVHPSNRKTSNFLTLFEFTNIISIRMAQMQRDSNYIGSSDYRQDAIEEINNKKCPLSIMRCIMENVYEIWEVNEMSYDPHFADNSG